MAHARIQQGVVADSGDVGAGTSYSFNHVCEDKSSRVVIVCTGSRDTSLGDIIQATATYGGVAMTSVGQDGKIVTTGAAVSVFMIVNPPAGSNTVAITHPGSVQNNRGFAVTFWNVDQATPQDVAAVTTNGDAASQTLSITPVTDRAMVIAATAWQGSADVVPTGDLSELADGSATATGTIKVEMQAAEKALPGVSTSSATQSSGARFGLVVMALRPRRRRIKVT